MKFWGTVLKTREISLNLGLPALARLGKLKQPLDRGSRRSNVLIVNKKQSLNNLQLIDPLKSNSGAVFSHFKSHKSLTVVADPMPCRNLLQWLLSLRQVAQHQHQCFRFVVTLMGPKRDTPQNQFVIPFPMPTFFFDSFFLQLSSHIQHLTQWHKREVNLWTGCPTKTHPPRSHDWSWWYSGWWGSQSWWKSERFGLSNANFFVHSREVNHPFKNGPPFWEKM